MAGHYLMEGKIQGLESETLQKFVVDNFDQQAGSHYNYLWTHCSESEKIMLLTILTLDIPSHSGKMAPTIETLTRFRPGAPHDISILMKRGLLDEQNGIYSLVSFPFGRWIRQEIMAAPGEEESQHSADGWLRSGGQEELKEAKGILPRFKKKYWPMLGDFAKDLSLEFAAVSTVELIKSLV